MGNTVVYIVKSSNNEEKEISGKKLCDLCRLYTMKENGYAITLLFHDNLPRYVKNRLWYCDCINLSNDSIKIYVDQLLKLLNQREYRIFDQFLEDQAEREEKVALEHFESYFEAL